MLFTIRVPFTWQPFSLPESSRITFPFSRFSTAWKRLTEALLITMSFSFMRPMRSASPWKENVCTRRPLRRS
jgi:hypothetical protein